MLLLVLPLKSHVLWFSWLHSRRADKPSLAEPRTSLNHSVSGPDALDPDSLLNAAFHLNTSFSFCKNTFAGLVCTLWLFIQPIAEHNFLVDTEGKFFHFSTWFPQHHNKRTIEACCTTSWLYYILVPIKHFQLERTGLMYKVMLP